MLTHSRSLSKLLFVCFLMTMVTACTGPVVVTDSAPPAKRETNLEKMKIRQGNQSILGEGGLFGLGKDSSSGGGGGGIGVNSYLWRATLDTISFMPIASADPFGGVIITDWHASNNSPNERFKLNVFILGRELRADGVRVSVFRQVLQSETWRDAGVPQGTSTKIEDGILMRARQLRIGTLSE